MDRKQANRIRPGNSRSALTVATSSFRALPPTWSPTTTTIDKTSSSVICFWGPPPWSASTARGPAARIWIRITPRVSSDGRFVAFNSDAGDLVADGTNFGDDNVFVRDVIGGTTTLVSVNQTGTADGKGKAPL